MLSSAMNRVLRTLRRAALQDQAKGLTDRQLLENFLATREEASFEALVRRHGPMVLGVCRRVLEHQQDAEDAFQATFLVLVRKASSIVMRDTVGNWLYGVAYRTAQKARAAAARRRVKEKHMARPEALPDEAGWQDLRPLLDRELNSLPDKYREPLVLCDLEGNTRKAAATQLGWSEGTLSGRLSRAREMLARRLARHGVALTGAAVAGVLSTSAASACVPVPLISTTIQAAALVAAGQATAAVVSAPVAALTEGVLKAMFVTQLKTVSAVLLAVGSLAVGASIWLFQPAAAPAGQETGTGPAQKENGGGGGATGLPMGPAPVQGLAIVNADAKLTVKAVVMGITKVGGGVMAAPAPGGAPRPPIAVGGGGGAGGGIVMKTEKTSNIRVETYDVNDVMVFDTKGNQLDKKNLGKLLKEETVVMVSFGQVVDPLHLRVLKEGTLILVVPAPQGFGGGFGGQPGAPGGGAAPGIAPPPRGGIGGQPGAPGDGAAPGIAPVPPAGGGFGGQPGAPGGGAGPGIAPVPPAGGGSGKSGGGN
jgi:RNA polymerase sigma factor (sigma-70 family)